ncbi:hypothetical protein GQ44DRAFT_625726 [Phaeosphaeriaceae sp. PMI808]|nr:hypothetical protein GQ44DRAFT_625726 [Phaeosphaeriaceae sp. PMI808]
MSAEYKNTDINKLALDAERDLNSTSAKQGHDGKFGASDSTRESGIDEAVTTKFPGSTVEYGTGASNNRSIPVSEGGDINPATGQLYKAGEFAHGGVGAPEAKERSYAQGHGGEDDVRGNTVDVDGATERQSGVK